MDNDHPAQRRYPPELKERAVRMVHELRRQDPGDTGVLSRVARQLGVGVESLRTWVKQAEIDGGVRPGTTTADARRITELAQGEPGAPPGQRHLAGGSQFLRGGARPPIEEVVTFIDAHRDTQTGGRRWGVEPICEQLQVAPSTYYDAKARPPSARAVRDAELGPTLVELWSQNYSVYGRRKLWKVAQRRASMSGATRWPASCGPRASAGPPGRRSASPPRPTRPPSGRPTW